MKYEDWLAHFNPNHDPQTGRFTGKDKSFGSVDNSTENEYNKNRAKRIIEKGKAAINRFLSRSGDEGVDKMKESVSYTNSQSGKSFDEIDRDLVSSINPGLNKPGGQTNCVGCGLAYTLGSLFGIHAKAKPSDFEYDTIFEEVFTDVRGDDEIRTIDETLKLLPNGSTGIIKTFDVLKEQLGIANGHILSYEKSKAGDVTLIDSQHDEIYANGILNEDLYGFSRCDGYRDFSHSKLKEDAFDKLSKYVIIERSDNNDHSRS